MFTGSEPVSAYDEMKDYRDFNLSGHNTFGLSETCSRYVEYETADELRSILLSLTAADMPLFHIGGGSNILLTRHYAGTMLHSAIKGIEATDNGDSWLLRCGSGETWDDVVAYAVAHGMYGIENLSLIPGEVGASAVQNIGAYGREACDVIDEIEALRIADASPAVFRNSDCGYGYRQSRFKTEWKGEYAITHVTYRLSKTFTPYIDYGNIRDCLDKRGIASPTAADIRAAIIDIRQSKLPDPATEGNAGSFFMNPVVEKAVYEKIAASYPDIPHYPAAHGHVKLPAGWLIDRCGWKGRAMSRAGVHDRQALVLVNKGGATGADIMALAAAVQHDVKQTFGIELHPEVIYL